MGNWQREFLCFVILASFLLLSVAECKKKKKKPNNNETTLFNFFRLVVYRLIYGFATMIGQQEAISEFMGGIFVPDSEGEDDGDYRDYLDGDDDYRDYNSYDY